MIKLYNNNKVVVCKLFLEDEEIECVPVKIENNNLYIKRTDSSINNISMENIRKVVVTAPSGNTKTYTLYIYREIY